MRLGSSALTDEAFIASLAGGTYPAEAFHHGDHIRLGWILLSSMSMDSAIAEVRRTIQSLAQRIGKTDLYHETITRGWMLLLASHEESSFAKFMAQNCDRLSAALLETYWKKATLTSQTARRQWVEPDIQPLPRPVPRPLPRATGKRSVA